MTVRIIKVSRDYGDSLWQVEGPIRSSSCSTSVLADVIWEQVQRIATAEPETTIKFEVRDGYNLHERVKRMMSDG